MTVKDSAADSPIEAVVRWLSADDRAKLSDHFDTFDEAVQFALDLDPCADEVWVDYQGHSYAREELVDARREARDG